MNPLLLKPNSDHTSQVVLNGKPIGDRDAYDYFRKEGREVLRQEVHAAFDRLEARYNPIVMEGAGSISEINLRETDLVNMPMARYADADVILVADIDRGGVFASAYGSIALQLPEDRKRIKELSSINSGEICGCSNPVSGCWNLSVRYRSWELFRISRISILKRKIPLPCLRNVGRQWKERSMWR